MSVSVVDVTPSELFRARFLQALEEFPRKLLHHWRTSYEGVGTLLGLNLQGEQIGCIRVEEKLVPRQLARSIRGRRPTRRVTLRE